MRFYRPLGRISTLTFGLGDILYDNHPVILRTERETLTLVQDYHPALRNFRNKDLQCLRQAVRKAEPKIHHGVTRWRFRSIGQVMLDAGLSAGEANMGTHVAMTDLAKWRSRIDVSQQTHNTLKQLAKKWPLVAIINGNAQPELLGLGDYFELMLRAGPRGRPKSFSNIYFLAAEKLNMPIDEILHVGDDLTTDVGGAIRSGMQACWIRPENGDLIQTWDNCLLPHLEVPRLASLTSLIQSADLYIYPAFWRKVLRFSTQPIFTWRR